jgi:hypothetical protein
MADSLEFYTSSDEISEAEADHPQSAIMIGKALTRASTVSIVPGLISSYNISDPACAYVPYIHTTYASMYVVCMLK